MDATITFHCCYPDEPSTGALENLNFHAPIPLNHDFFFLHRQDKNISEKGKGGKSRVSRGFPIPGSSQRLTLGTHWPREDRMNWSGSHSGKLFSLVELPIEGDQSISGVHRMHSINTSRLVNCGRDGDHHCHWTSFGGPDWMSQQITKLDESADAFGFLPYEIYIVQTLQLLRAYRPILSVRGLKHSNWLF